MSLRCPTPKLGPINGMHAVHPQFRHSVARGALCRCVRCTAPATRCLAPMRWLAPVGLRRPAPCILAMRTVLGTRNAICLRCPAPKNIFDFACHVVLGTRHRSAVPCTHEVTLHMRAARHLPRQPSTALFAAASHHAGERLSVEPRSATTQEPAEGARQGAVGGGGAGTRRGPRRGARRRPPPHCDRRRGVRCPAPANTT